MELLKFEHRKLWRRKSVQISVLLCTLYLVVFGGLLSYQWFTFGSMDDYTSAFGNNFDGYSYIREKQAYAKQWEGDLTDETLQAMVRDYQKLRAQTGEQHSQIADRFSLSSWVNTLWPELEKADEPYKNMIVWYVDPAQLTNFDARRENALETFLDLNGQTEQEKAYFLNMNKKVELPLQYRWTEGWVYITSDFIPDCGILFAIFLSIAIAPVFAGEWHNNTKALIATTKNGWGKLAGIKVLVSFLFALELYFIEVLSSIFLQILFLGTAGADMPIQCIKLIATAPWTVLQAEIYEYAYLLLATLGYTGIILLFSALTHSNYAALLLSLAIVFVPMATAKFLPLWGQKALELLPFVGSPTDIFRTNAYHIFGKIIWSPYLLIVIPVTLGIVCLPFAIRSWSKRVKV